MVQQQLDVLIIPAAPGDGGAEAEGLRLLQSAGQRLEGLVGEDQVDGPQVALARRDDEARA